MEKAFLQLDNSAKIYPLMVTKRNQNLFRLAVDFYDNVQPEALQKAIDAVMPRFPLFSMQLMKGFFWYYLLPNKRKLIVREEKAEALGHITFNNENGYNLRVLYYKQRISVEFYHILCDGSGGMEFMKSLVHSYLHALGHDLPTEGILTYDSEPLAEEAEDAFNKYYKKLPLKELEIKSMQGGKSFIFDDKQMRHGKGITRLQMDSLAVLNLAKSHGATLTEYLTSIYAEAIYRVKGESADNIQLFVPINLRKEFPSKTLRNFSLFSRIPLKMGDSLANHIITVRECLKRDTDKELLEKKIATTVRPEKLLALRIVPLFMKKAVFSISNLFFGKAKKTSTISNLGIIKLPSEYSRYVDNFHFQFNTNKNSPLNVAICSYNNKMVICFPSSLLHVSVPCEFAKLLTESGIEVVADSNYWEVDYDTMS